MATKFTFDGKRVTLPGSYSRIVSSIKNPPQSATYGNVLVIDTGKGANFGGGSGIAGELESGKDAIQSHEELDSLRETVRGGLWWLLAKPLFIPDKDLSVPGASTVHFIKAAETFAAKLEFTFGTTDTKYQLTDFDITGSLPQPLSSTVYTVANNMKTVVICGADVADSLNGKYFLISSKTVNYYVWFKTSGGSLLDPAISGKTGIQVSVATGANATTVGTAVATALAAVGSTLVFSASSTTGTVTATTLVLGTTPLGGAGTSGFTVTTTYQNVTSSKGWFTDSGEKSSDYSNSEDFIKIFTTEDAGKPLQFNFTSFHLETNYDYLEIYDGGSTSSTLIGRYTGSNSPGVILASGDSITFKFHSDSDVVYSGFEAEISCPGLASNNTLPSGTYKVYSVGGTYTTRAYATVVIYNGAIISSVITQEGNYTVAPTNTTDLYFVDILDGNQTLTLDHDRTYTLLPISGGKVTVKYRNEGIVGNAVLTDNVLTRGVQGKMRASTNNTSKFVVDFYTGTFKGLDSDSEAYDFITEANSVPQLLITSPEFVNVQTLIDWMKIDVTFNFYFKLTYSQVNGDGNVISGDITTNASVLGIEGSETYSTTHLDEVLDHINLLDYSLILVNDSGDDAQSSDNSKILYHILNESKFKQFMFVTAGKNKDEFSDSKDTAAFFNSSKTIVVHGAPYKKRTSGGLKEMDTMYKTAAIVGRVAGLPPQVPLTFKGLDIDGEVHSLNTKEQEQALDSGLLVTIKDDDFGAFVVLEDVNSLQENDFILNEDGQSHLLQYERIAAQVDKQLIINSKKKLLGQKNGPNRNTLSEEVLVEFTKGELKSLTVADDGTDNLLIQWKNVQAKRTGDSIATTYEIAPNIEINKLFFTGRTTEI